MTGSAERRVWWRALAVTAGVLSCLKGLRRPNLWAATQAMVNYDHGFTKRGLFGATLGSWLHLERYARFSVASLLLLFGLLALLAWMTERSGAFERLGEGEPVAIFFASYAVTYLAHLVGYLDIPLAMMTVGLLAIRRPMPRAIAALPVCVAAVLIHEMFLVVFLPVILLSFWVDGMGLEQRARNRVWMMAGVTVVLSVGVTVRLALERPMTPAQVAEMRADIAGRVDFPVREDVLAVLERSSADNVRMMREVMHSPFFQHRFLASAATFAPAILMLLAAVAWSAGAVQSKGLRRATIAAGLAAALSPAAMNVFGYDFGRWDALVCLEAYLVLLCLARMGPARKMEFGVGYRVVAVVVVALSLASGEWFAREILMDGVQANSFGTVQRLMEWRHAPGARLLRPPEQ